MGVSIINVRLEDEDKKAVNEVCNEVGLNMSTAFNIFVKTMLRTGGLPFEVTVKRPNLETLKAIEEAKKISRDPNIKSYNTVKEVMKALEEDWC